MRIFFFLHHTDNKVCIKIIIPARQTLCSGCWRCGITIRDPALSLFSDEAKFSRVGIVNMCSQHVLSDSNPHCTIPRKHSRNFLWTSEQSRQPCSLSAGSLHLARPFDMPQHSVPSWNKWLPVCCRLFRSTSGETFMHNGAPAHFPLRSVTS